MEIADDGSRIAREDVRIKFERIVAKVPTRRTESSAQKNEGVAGEILFSESSRLGEDIRFRRKGATRLDVTERPFRRHDWHPRKATVLAHRDRRFARVNSEKAGCIRV